MSANDTSISAVAARVNRFGGDRRGATAIEYALIASCISIAILTAVTTLGDNVKSTLYDKLAALF